MGSVPTPLRVLLVEDSEDDAELVLRELRRSGYEPRYDRVQTGPDLEKALEKSWELILCDYAMPELDAPTAIAIVRRKGLDTPLIVVSGTIGEETAVEVMRHGANDYLLKGNLKRLGAAIARELRDAKARAEARRAVAAREAAEHSFRAIIERSPDLVLVHRDGRIVYANQALVTRLGWKDGADLTGKDLATVVDAREVRADSEGALEERWSTRDGRQIPVEVVRVETSFDGQEALVDVGRDLTERRQIAAAMIEMDRMAAIGTLAAGVAHEINNPLAYVLANLEYVTSEVDGLIDEIPKPTLGKIEPRVVDLRQAVADMSHGARRVRDIVQDLRTFSRSDEDKVSMVDVRHVLDSSLRMATVQIRHRARIVREYDEVPMVLANESRLGQVFLNLVINAAQAVPEGSIDTNQILLSTRFVDGRVVATVKDSGIGIAPENLVRIFEPFFTTKPVGQGTGLGLAICQRIVKTLGGEIDVDSTPGRGTTFIVRLPPADTATAAPKRATTRPSQSPRRGRVLVVDDEPAIGVALRRILLGEHDVTNVTSAVAARERILAGEEFDVILCDLMMPGMSGAELHAELAKHAPGLADRMIFLTGATFTSRAEDFLEESPNPRLAKPVDIDQLRSTITSVITGGGSTPPSRRSTRPNKPRR